MLAQLCMLLCPVSHICDGQKTCFPTMLQTLFFAHEIESLKLSKTQNFRKMRQFLNRALINGLIYFKSKLLLENYFQKMGIYILVGFFYARLYRQSQDNLIV